MADDGADSATADDSIAKGRSRRTRNDKSGRAAALEKLRNLRGSKNKYEIAEVQNVYDVVDESEYSKKVYERQKDDWIVDDGSGYYEDGREIFDDDIHEPIDDRTKRKSKLSKRDKGSEKAEKDSQQANFQSIRSMLVNMPVKRKRPEVASSSSNVIDPDAMLSEFMKELHNDKQSSSSSTSDIIRKIAAPKFDEAMPFAVKRNRVDPGPNVMPRPSLEKFQNGKQVSSSSNNSPTSGILKKFPVAPKVIEKVPLAVNIVEPAPSHDAADFDDMPSDFMDDFDNDEPSLGLTTSDSDAISKIDDPKVDEPVAVKTIDPLPNNTVDPEAMFGDFTDFMEEFDNDVESFTPEIINEVDGSKCDENVSSAGREKCQNFYWLDIFEEPRNPGMLYLFGKIKSPQGYSSCCVVVKNLTRCVYLLPRETRADGTPVSYEDVHNEFKDVASRKYKISHFKSRKLEKNYCFELNDVPTKAEYMEIRYSGSLPLLPQDFKGETFSRAFGTSTSLMETFLLEKQFKGPSWLQISNNELIAGEKQQSWCKFEFSCDVSDVQIHPDSNNIRPPPLVLVSLNIQAVNDAASKKDSIVFIGVAVNKNFLLQTPLPPNGIYHDHFCILNKPIGEIWPLDVDRVINKRTLKMDSERSMLGCLLAKLHQLDPDVYVGHDLNVELLLLQILQHKVPHWSRIGRLKRSVNPVAKNSKMLDFRAALAGRLLCDVKISAMELIRARSYDLASLSSQILGMKEDQVGILTGPEIKQLFDSSEGLRNFVNWGMQHCVLNIRLMNELQVMPLAVQITTIAGNMLCRTLLGGRSERNEYLLLHAFHNKGYIVPDKYKFSKFMKKEKDEEEGEEEEGGNANKDKKSGKSGGPSYSGGLVLAPKKGFYDNYIVLMDFNSLYPSIIQEYNVCFTTAIGNEFENEEGRSRGVLPEEIRKLVESRRQVKNLMKDSKIAPDLMRQYDIRQKALKLTANSMYGCLGFRNSRFYAKNLAAYITGKGREILEKSKESVEKMGYEVIYGDTDSLMINSSTQDVQTVYQIGNRIKSEINRTYKLLELEIDGIFRFLLLLKKKKYAALVYNPKANGEAEYVMELKGLDIVRRDWAPVGANTAKSILNEIMSEQPLDDKIYKVCKILNDVTVQLREGNIPLKDLLITKQLAKNPEDYKEAQGLYHVQVALRMNKRANLPKKFRNGDTVSYLFCTDGLPHHISELGLKPEPVKVNSVQVDMEVDGQTSSEVKEVKEEKEEVLKPDPQYYLAHQVHPVVSRICDPIPGLDPSRIAEALGLDASSYKKRRVAEDSNEDKFLGVQSESEKYKSCEKFSFQCLNMKSNGQICGQEIVFDSAIAKTDHGVEFTVEQPCTGCQGSLFNINQMKNNLSLFMRKFILKYYENVYICEDPSCIHTERIVPLHLERGYPVCSCKQGLMCKDYTDAQLYRQLNYLVFLFDVPKQIEELNSSEKELIKMRLQRARISQKDKSSVEAFHDELKEFVMKTLNSSAYSDISLKNLFQHFETMMIQRKARRQAENISIYI